MLSPQLFEKRMLAKFDHVSELKKKHPKPLTAAFGKSFTLLALPRSFQKKKKSISAQIWNILLCIPKRIVLSILADSPPYFQQNMYENQISLFRNSNLEKRKKIWRKVPLTFALSKSFSTDQKFGYFRSFPLFPHQAKRHCWVSILEIT